MGSMAAGGTFNSRTRWPGPQGRGYGRRPAGPPARHLANCPGPGFAGRTVALLVAGRASIYWGPGPGPRWSPGLAPTAANAWPSVPEPGGQILKAAATAVGRQGLQLVTWPIVQGQASPAALLRSWSPAWPSVPGDQSLVLNRQCNQLGRPTAIKN